ncbi:MAG: HNH endonuclease [Butyricicoccus sp.]|nr:HNH endonuclease [Butyricicoccus sp.]
MAFKPCPRCGCMIPAGSSYCPTCKPAAEAEAEAARERKAEFKQRKYNQSYNARRDPKYSAFYRSKAWRAQSRAKLQSVGYRCEARTDNCTGLAVEVHHIKPIRTPDGWDRRLDWDNLEAVCTACHNARHPERFQKRCNDDVIDLRTLRR